MTTAEQHGARITCGGCGSVVPSGERVTFFGADCAALHALLIDEHKAFAKLGNTLSGSVGRDVQEAWQRVEAHMLYGGGEKDGREGSDARAD